MADHVITITDQIVVLGPSRTNLWGEFVWGVDQWGNDPDLFTSVEKVLFNDIALDQTITGFDVAKTTSLGEISGTFEMSSENLKDGVGYYYVFTKPETEAENRAITVWTEV